MKRVCVAMLSVMALMGISGCRSKPDVDPTRVLFNNMRKEADLIMSKGGLASVGLGESRNTQLAIAKAKVEARRKLAQVVKTRIENMEKSYIEETGITGTSEISALFASSVKQITSQALKKIAPKEQKYVTHDGVTTACVLMAMNPAIIGDVLASKLSDESIKKQFYASKTYKKFDIEIKQYSAFEKNKSQGI